MEFESSIFLFRRDLRLIDNLALEQACLRSKLVFPVFIFDSRQVKDHPYRSEAALEFMFNCLKELNEELLTIGSKIHFFEGQAEQIIYSIAKDMKANAVFCSKDYTLFSRKRDAGIEAVCKKEEIQFFSMPNILLNEPESILSKSGTPYTVYTFYAKTAAKISVPAPVTKLPGNLGKSTIKTLSFEEARDRYLEVSNSNLVVKGGRKEALKLISKVPEFSNYQELRNFPALSATSYLSAHNKFGTISVREFFHSIRSNFNSEHTLIKELYWRDFFTQIAFHFPDVFKQAFQSKYKNLSWENNARFFDAWKNGQTGFPIVDAGMRELNKTGFMHNRVRMIVASFLCKDLLIDWRQGERYFARQLVDYDPCVNNGNWQWAASTGCDAQPYFRIFNPWLQAEKFDREALYIKKWVPELKNLSAKQIHRLYAERTANVSNYPAPMVEHSEQKIRALRLFTE